MTDDEIAALLAEARARSEVNATPPRRVRLPGTTSLLVDLVRMVPLILVVVFVLLLGRGTGFL